MKNYAKVFQLGIAMLMLIFISSCSTNQSSLTATPADASFVMVIDGKAINEKSGVQDITQTKAYQQLLQQMSEEELSNMSQFDYILKDSKESGLGFNEEFMMFVKIADSEPIIGFNILIKDKAKFDAFAQKIVDNENTEAEIITEDNVSLLMNNDDRVMIAWNDQQLVILAHENSAEEALANEAKALLGQTADQSISSNSLFADFYAKKKDISFWFDYETIFKGFSPAEQMMMTAQMPFNLAGTYINGYVSFEKGQVVAEYETIMNDEMTDFMEKYDLFNDKFDTDVLKMMPSPSYANMEISMNFFNYYQLIMDMYSDKQMDMDSYAEMAEAEIGITIEELLKSISGEVAISLHDIKMVEKESMSYDVDENGEFAMKMVTKMSPEFMYSGVIKFNDATVWDIVESKLAEMGLEKTDNYYMIPNADIALAYKDDVMIISNDINLISQILEDGETDPNLNSGTVAKNISNFPTYMEMNLDLDEYPADFITFMKEEEEEAAQMINILNHYKGFRMIPEDMTHAKMILELKDDSKNSLEVILNSFDETVEALSQN